MLLIFCLSVAVIWLLVDRRSDDAPHHRRDRHHLLPADGQVDRAAQQLQRASALQLMISRRGSHRTRRPGFDEIWWVDETARVYLQYHGRELMGWANGDRAYRWSQTRRCYAAAAPDELRRAWERTRDQLVTHLQQLRQPVTHAGGWLIRIPQTAHQERGQLWLDRQGRVRYFMQRSRARRGGEASGLSFLADYGAAPLPSKPPVPRCSRGGDTAEAVPQQLKAAPAGRKRPSLKDSRRFRYPGPFGHKSNRLDRFRDSRPGRHRLPGRWDKSRQTRHP